MNEITNINNTKQQKKKKKKIIIKSLFLVFGSIVSPVCGFRTYPGVAMKLGKRNVLAR